MTKVLVLANETIGGEKLLDAIQARSGEDVSFHVVVPQTRPKFGNVIYDEAVRDSAQVRVDLARAWMREHGIASSGEVGDGDPYLAALDAIAAEGIDEVIISTLPAGTSGWLKRDLPERLREETGLPVEHVIVDLAKDGLPFGVTLVAANVTVSSDELSRRLKELAHEGPRRFIAVVPQDAVHGGAVAQARERLSKLLESLHEDGIVAAGMIGDPDPYTAILNAVQYFHISEIVISTLPVGQLEVGRRQARRPRAGGDQQAGRAHRVRAGGRGGLMEAAALEHGHHEHHGPPEAHRSSRVDPRTLGMLLFIISEVMVFGAFFTAYFFIRVVGGAEWPAEGTELPKLIAGVNTAVLISSSFTMHWALESVKSDNRFGLKAGDADHVPARRDVPVRADQRVRARRLLAAGPRAGHDLLRAHRPARRARLHRPDAARDGHRAGVPRALLVGGAPRRRGAGDLLALRRHHVGRRLHDRLHHLINPLRSEREAFQVLLYVLGGRRCRDRRWCSLIRAIL